MTRAPRPRVRCARPRCGQRRLRDAPSRQDPSMPPDRPPQRLLLRSELIAAGHSANEIRVAIATGRWTAVRRGAYCESETVVSLGEVERHLLRARAVAGRSPDLVVSHISAAAAHGWPIWDAPLGQGSRHPPWARRKPAFRGTRRAQRPTRPGRDGPPYRHAGDLAGAHANRHRALVLGWRPPLWLRISPCTERRITAADIGAAPDPCPPRRRDRQGEACSRSRRRS